MLYTQGGPENLRTARKYFAAAVELTNANCLRALYGLWACASAVATIKGQHRQPEDESDLLVSGFGSLGMCFISICVMCHCGIWCDVISRNAWSCSIFPVGVIIFINLFSKDSVLVNTNYISNFTTCTYGGRLIVMSRLCL